MNSLDIESSYIAFDILPMSSTERQGGVKVAASALFRDGKTKEWSQLDRDKLLKVIKKHNFQYLGTDNPGEIIEVNETIAGFCDNLPANCSFVHVNLTRSGNSIPLQSLLRQYDIASDNKKLSPVKTARALVELMRRGVGMVLEPYENETLIRVGRPSGSSKGGWSQARYQRQAEEVVAREANKIKNLLDSAKLDYDEIIRSTKYGAKMARYHIFNTRTKIDKVLEGQSFYPAKIRIWSPKKNLVTHRPLSPVTEIKPQFSRGHYKRLIVGIDPGMTTGVALMNLNGKIVTVFSRKNLSRGQLITEIANYGVPVLVCADVNPIPTFVSKIASTYNANIMSPDITLSKEVKRHLSNTLEMKRRLDSHERDALAAVFYAYRKLEDNFQKIEAEDLTSGESEIAKGLLIRGLSIIDSVKSAKKEVKSREVVVEEKDYHEMDAELVRRVDNLLDELNKSEGIISNLRAHAGRMEAKNTLLTGKIKIFEKQIDLIKDQEIRDALQTDIVKNKDRLIKQQQSHISELESQNRKMEERIHDLEEMLWVTIDEGGLPVKILPKFSNNAITQLENDDMLGNGDIVLILDPTGAGPQTAEKLVAKKPKFVFIENHDLPRQAFEVFYENEIPVLRAERYGIVRTSHLGIINQENFLKAKEEHARFVREREDKIKTEKIFQTIENYKYERARELEDSQKSYDDFELDDEM